ncbi:hypothetical protein ACLKA7_012484 [Drosophila subpalustris]
MLGAHFGAHFPAYGAPPPPPPHTPLLATPRAHHAHAHTHAHHHHHHHASAFYPPPLVYWPYPSPPVSPTTYYSQPGAHSPSHQHQALYPLDFFPPSPLSPPNAGLILTPSKSAVPFVPAKLTSNNSINNNNIGNINNNNKLTVTAPIQANTSASQSASTPTAEAAAPAQSVMPPALQSSSQALLSLDTNHAASATPALKTGIQTVAANATPIVTNNCVELYIS